MIVAALVFVLVGCAPPVVGGTWHTGPAAAGSRVADDIEVEFIDGSNVQARVVQGGLATCPERHTRTMQGTWRVNDGNAFVYFFCDVEVQCNAGTINLCELLENTIVGHFEQRSMNVLASVEHRPVTLTRR